MVTPLLCATRQIMVLGVMAGLMAATASAQTAPFVAFLQPTSANAGDTGTIVTVTGSGFSFGSIVYWQTQPLTTVGFSANQISALLPAQLLTTPGQFAISVQNAGLLRSNVVNFTVLASPISITTATLPAAQVGSAFEQTLAVAGGSAPYTWVAVDTLPAGLTLTPAGQITGMPSTAGSFTFAVRVADATQRTATKTFALTISAPAVSIATAATLPVAVEGVAYNQALQVGTGAAPYRWSAGAGAPPGISINASTGVLSGVPTTRGAYSFSVQLTDNTGASAAKTFNLTVQAPPLTITTVSPLFAGVVGAPYSQTFAASGTPPYTWMMRSSVPGLTLSQATGTLAGTPEQAGTYTLTVQVRDGSGGTATKDFTFTVEQPTLLITNNSQLPTAAFGMTYQQRLLATGGRSPYTWAITSGLAPGFTLDPATGILSSTSTSSGTFSFTVTVRDSANAIATRQFTVTVESGPIQLSSVAGHLQNTIGNPFSLSLPASGGAPPYSWSANGLPEGLQIDAASGAIMGTFRTVGTFLFTVRVSDTARSSATELVTVEVNAPTLPTLRTLDTPDSTGATNQISTRLQLSGPYTLPLNGQLILSFAPETGLGDPAVQFSTGGRTTDFQIPMGTVDAQFSNSSIGLQTGTVAGTITLSARLQTQGATLTPSPIVLKTIRVERTAPAITSAVFSRTGSTIEVRITGYSTSREITQGVFRFRATNGSTLTTSEINLPLETVFGNWYRESGSTQYGGQFLFNQQFTIQGDANAVTPVSVTLTNRVGSTTADIRQ